MFSVTKNLNFCYGHRLLNYIGKCAHLHGHNAVVQITFSGSQLNPLGILIDFDEIRAVVQTFLDETFDHRLILHQDDPLVPILKSFNEPIQTLDENPTAENLAKVIYQFAKSRHLPIESVKFWETPSACAEYQEST